MRKLFKQKIYFVTIFVLLFSCQKEEVTIETNPNQNSSTSDEVSMSLASEVALNFSNGAKFNNQTLSLKSTSTNSNFEDREIDEVIVAPSEDGTPSLYIINFIPQGYVIISGTQKESPILGYSDNSVFKLDSIPITIAFWLADRMDKIQVLKDVDVVVADSIVQEWAYQSNLSLEPNLHDFEIAPREGYDLIQKGPLLTTTWGQGWGYNSLLEPIDGTLPPTGCVATAIAQVMKYHEYPSNYNWSLMPNTYGTNETALLMKDIGEAVHMDYGVIESGASMSDAKSALVNDFGYSSTASYINYTVGSVVSEISNYRPVIMDGYNTYYTTTSGWWIFEQTTHHYEQGHAWVCDGYKRRKYYTTYNYGTPDEYTESNGYGPYYLHMNWGWGSSGAHINGWFLYDHWEIDGSNFTDGNPRDYQYRKKCIIGIKP